MKKKKVALLIGAVAIVAVAVINVNMSFVKEKTPKISLAQVHALANSEDPCELPETTLLDLSLYKMVLTNISTIGGFAIRNVPTKSSASYGLDVEQAVVTSRSSIAIRAHAQAPSQTKNSKAYGVYAMAGNAANGYNYGVFAGLSGCNNGTALYATTNAGVNELVNGKFAGYFLGAVHVAGKMSVGSSPNPAYNLYVAGSVGVNGSIFQTSDERCKTNVKNLESSALDKVTKLRPVTYNFKPEDMSKYYKSVPDSVKIENESALREYFSLGKGLNHKKKHIGFLAQELRQVFPELVQLDGEGIMSVDYISLIPVLAGAIQEQNKTILEQSVTINNMNETIELLSKRLEALENPNRKIAVEHEVVDNVQLSNFSFSLFPNPASSGSVVTINYTMHVDAPVVIELYSMRGQRVRQILPNQHQQAGNYSVQTSVSGLQVGTYIVRVTSGNHVESKQLLVS